MPYDVKLDRAAGEIAIRGKLLSSSANPSRRLSGRVSVEFLDESGAVIAIRHADPHRASPAKHTRRARLEIPSEELPHGTAAIRVLYR
jgi:hypothetical protein